MKRKTNTRPDNEAVEGEHNDKKEDDGNDKVNENYDDDDDWMEEDAGKENNIALNNPRDDENAFDVKPPFWASAQARRSIRQRTVVWGWFVENFVFFDEESKVIIDLCINYTEIGHTFILIVNLTNLA